MLTLLVVVVVVVVVVMILLLLQHNCVLTDHLCNPWSCSLFCVFNKLQALLAMIRGLMYRFLLQTNEVALLLTLVSCTVPNDRSNNKQLQHWLEQTRAAFVIALITTTI